LAEEWYAVYTRFQHEKSAASLLQKKGFEAFVPVYRAVHRWQDRNQMVILPLFPCYLFLRTNLHRKLDVVRTAGVRGVVESAGNACEVPEAQIEALQKICSLGSRVQPHPFLERGDAVRIRTGPLAGFEGLFIREKNECRVVLSMELVRKGVSVEVDFRDVERCQPWRMVAAPLEMSERSA
jgi:transcription antitermination factor NusG